MAKVNVRKSRPTSAMLTTAPSELSCVRRVLDKLFVSDNYYKSIQPIFFFTYLCGITPFRVMTDRYGNKSLKSNLWGYVNPTFHVFAFAYCYTYATYHNESFIGYFLHTEISNFGSKLHVLTCLLGAITVYVTAVLRKKKLLHSVNILLRADSYFEQIHLGCNYTVIIRYVLVVISIVLFLNAFIVITGLYCLFAMNVHPSFPVLYNAISELLGISFSIALFCLMTRCASRRIEALNKIAMGLYSLSVW